MNLPEAELVNTEDFERKREPEPDRESIDQSERLARSLAMMRATLESTTDAIVVTDADGRVSDFNDRFVELWRIPFDVMATRDYGALLDYMCAAFANPVAARDQFEAVINGSPLESFDVLELADGRVLERTSRIQFIERSNVGRVWSFRDVTDRRRTDDALRDESRVLELLNETGTVIASQIELQPLAQAVTDAATKLSGARYGAFFFANHSAGRAADPDSFELLAVTGASRDTVEQIGQPRPTHLLGPTFRGERAVRCDDVTLDDRYGSMPPHYGMPIGHLPIRSYLAVPVKARSGDLLGALLFGHPEPGVFTARSERIISGVAAQAGVAIDNAQLFDAVRRAAEQRATLLEAERAARSELERIGMMKDEFLATLSHELRTPLNAVLGWAEVLLERPHGPEDLRRGLETIARNARAQARLIEDLLDMNRIVSGKIRLAVQRTDLSSVVGAALDAIKPSADAKSIRLQRIVDPLAGPVLGDPDRLQQVVWNLLSNAVKFTPKAGRVQIAVAKVESHVEITVSDTGPGISAEFAPFVFEQFRQADASITRQHGGLGLGLAIVKQLVELHGGSVRLEPRVPDHGATFVVVLPLAAIRGDVAPRERSQTDQSLPPPPPVSLNGLRVLVIDDEADARDLIKWVLANAGAEVMTAGSANDGLALLQQQSPDVVISDIGMPGRDGYQLIGDIRNLSPEHGGKTPAIALTAFARSEDRTRAMLAGYQIHLTKPIAPPELLATVASLAGRTGFSDV